MSSGLPLQGKVALVTGAARGIGRAIALRLADDGAAVAVADVHPEPFRGESYYRLRERWSGEEETTSTADAVRERGVPSLELAMDVSDREAVRRAVERCASELGPVDVLVNNAAIVNNIATIDQMDPDAWEHEIRVNLTGTFQCIQAVAPGMAERGWGRVVNIASVAARQPGLGQPGYTSSKAGVIALTQAVAQEFGGRGVTSNAVLPGLIGTPLVLSMPEKLMKAIVGSTPVGRLGEPSEVANLVAFLATPSAGFITATAIPCDGGFLGAPVFGLGD